MKSQMSYKTKRNVIIIVVIAILVVLASIGTYLYIRGNDETQAMSQVNGTSEDRAGEDYQVAQADNDNQADNNQNENNEENTDNETSTPENNEENENSSANTETNIENNNNSNNTTTVGNSDSDNEEETYTQTVTTTETVERTETIVGFNTASINGNMDGVNANIPELTATAEAVTGVESNYVINGMEITYNIRLTSSEALEGINVSAIIPEGTELVEGSISDDGVVLDGNITWKVDVVAEKTVSFKVNVIKESGEITLAATANGKDIDVVTNIIDEAPVLIVTDPNKYQMEVGTEYVEKGYSAIDKEDGDITSKVELSYRFQAKDAPTWENPDPTELDTSRLGVYKITYTVTDSMGNVAKGTRTVEIVDTQAPVIAGLDDGEYVNRNEIVTITDATLDIVTINGVEQEHDGKKFQDKLTHEGTFVIVAIDQAGNRTEKTVTIDKTAPVIAGLDDGEYVNRNEIVTITDDNLETVTINGVEQEHDGTRFQDKLTHEGTYTIVAIDKAGNRTEKTVTIDKTAPVIAGLDDGEYVNRNEIVTITDDYLETVMINGKEQEHDGKRFEDKLTHEGTYTIVAIDKAGNRTEKTVTIDKTAPVIAGLDDGEYVNRNEIVTITDDNLETVTINGVEQEHDGKKFEDKLTHEGTYTIVAIDKAGNRTEKTVTIDKTAPKLNKVQIINNSNPDSMYIKDGETVRINVTFDEELQTLPTLTIGTQTAEFKQIEGGNGEVIYQADLVINAEENTKLEEGKLKFTISGYADKVGNVGEDITEEDASNYLIYDNTAPTATLVKIQNSKDKDTTWAKEGEDVWVYVIVDEELSVEPTFTIAGKEVPIIQRENGKPWGEGWYKYAALLKMTSDIPEGNIEFKVSGYTDLAGNVGTDITTTTDGSKIVYDRTAPTFNPSYWTKTVEADKDSEFTEDMYPETGASDNLSENVTIEMVNNTVDMGVPGTYKLQYVLTDEAGNKTYHDIFITVEDTTAPTFNPSYWTKTVEADKNATFTDFPEVSGTDNAEGNVTVEMVNNTVNMGVPGEYKLQYVTTDANGNKAYNDIFITVVDTTIPTFSPSYWTKTIEADKNATFTDFPTVTADDNALGDIIIERIKNEVNMGVPGEYKIGYKTVDASGNTAWNDIFITVVDTTKPTVSLVGEDNIEIEINTEYNDEGLIIEDNAEGKLITTTKVYYSKTGEDGTWTDAKDNKVDTSVLGSYNIWYTVTDESGNVSQVRRTVKVVDTIAPTISLKGEEFIVVERETEYEEPGLNIEDNSNGKTTINTTIYYSETGEDGTWTTVDEVDTSILGYYNIWYSATDEAGNTSEGVRRRLQIVDTTAPTATVEYSTTELTNGNVMVTIKASEPVTLVDNDTWLRKEDGTVYQKAYPMNTDETITFVDVAGNKGSVNVKIENIDKTAPTATVEYSTTELTNGNVMVTIKASESITLVDNDTWLRKEDGTVYQKAYPMNTDETITFVDAAGNEGSVNVKIENIDKIAPTVTIEYSTTEPTANDVHVTLTSSEEITFVDSGTWHSNGNVHKKAYNKNQEQTVTFVDKAGNVGTCVITINNIIK